MNRAIFAFVMAPLLGSMIFFGWMGFVALPFMLVVTALVALPLFLLFRHFGWLQWWAAVFSGAVCGLVASLTFFNGSGGSWDRLVNSNNVTYLSIGAAIGLLFWWIGIFRNDAFESVGRRFPVSVIAVVPLFAAAFALVEGLQPAFHEGRVLQVIKASAAIGDRGLVSVRLTDGNIIQAEYENRWPGFTYEGKCFHVEQRWSTLQARWIYDLSSQFGGEVNVC